MMNRKEFKNLLTEWKQNFDKSVILERGPIRDFYKKEISGSLCPISESEMHELTNFAINLINFSKKRKDLYADDYESLANKYSFNISIPKDISLLNAMLDFTKNNKIKNFINLALNEAKSGNKDPVVFFKDQGDFTGADKAKDQETSPYVTHDLEHAIFASNIYDSESADRDLEMFSKEDERRGAWRFNKEYSVNKDDFYSSTRFISDRLSGDIEKLNKVANKEKIKDEILFTATDQESNAIKIELAFKAFFDEINYAKGILVGDIMPSVWAYCISNMKNKHDLDEVNSANIPEAYKEIIRYTLENSHDNCLDLLNKFLQSQDNRIVFINTWG